MFAREISKRSWVLLAWIVLNKFSFLPTSRASLVAQTVKILSAMPETWVWWLGWEDPLEKEMATHSVILPGEIHGQKTLAGYSPWGHKDPNTTGQLIQQKLPLPMSIVIDKFCFQKNSLSFHNLYIYIYIYKPMKKKWVLVFSRRPKSTLIFRNFQNSHFSPFSKMDISSKLFVCDFFPCVW